MKYHSMPILCVIVFVWLSFWGVSQIPDLQQFNKPSNMGRDFYFSVPPSIAEQGASSVMLYITSPISARVRIEVISKNYSAEYVTKANEVTEIQMTPSIAEPYYQTADIAVPAEKVYPKAAVHLTSDVPIVAIACTRFPNTAGSFLLLPTESLGTEYIIASMADMSWMYNGYTLPSEVVITAVQDNTNVSFKLGGNAVTTTSGGLKSGQSESFFMHAGDVIVIANAGSSKEGDLSGSRITSNKPVTVTSGNVCANIPTTARWCDYIAETEFPTHTWGKTILVPRLPSRTNSGMVKIFTKEPDTYLKKSCKPYRLMQQSGGIEGAGYIYERADASKNGVAVYSADKPISVTYFNPGLEDDNVTTDPFQMGLMPVEQFSTSAIITAPGTKTGLTFPEHYVILIYELSTNNSLPDDMEIGYLINGAFTWRKVSSVFGPNVGDIFPCVVNKKQYAAKQFRLPSETMYMVRCGSPFGLYSFGFNGNYAYGNTSAATMYDLTKNLDTLPPSPVILSQNSTTISGEVTDLPAVDSVRSNISKIQSGFNSTNCLLVTSEIKPLITSTATWSVHQIDSTKRAKCYITFTDRAGNDTTVEHTFLARVVKPTIMPSVIVMCAGDTVILTTSSVAYRYKWSTGDTLQTIRKRITSAGTYTFNLTITNEDNNSASSDSVTIVVNPLPQTSQIQRVGNVLSIDSIQGATYQWYYKKSTIVPGATNRQYEVTTEGEVWYVVASVNGCATESNKISVQKIVTVQEQLPEVVLISPNPVTTSITVTAPFTEHSTIEVITYTGEPLITINVANKGIESQTIGLETLSNGVYFIIVRCGNYISVRKFVKLM